MPVRVVESREARESGGPLAVRTLSPQVSRCSGVCRRNRQSHHHRPLGRKAREAPLQGPRRIPSRAPHSLHTVFR